MKTRTIFSIMLIALLALSGILMITASGCSSTGTSQPALPRINPETRNHIISVVYTIGNIAANAYIDKMVADNKITAAEATTYKQIVSDIKLPSPTASEVTATPGNAGAPSASNEGADVSAANNSPSVPSSP